MDCKFLNHGIALAYQETVKPCCVWQFDKKFQNEHKINVVNLATWHQHPDLQQARELLKKDVWPTNCQNCEKIESQGRQDSIRLGGANSYANYNGDDITLEIRPGSVCNFACQTCWPVASSRVASFYKLANVKHHSDRSLLSSVDIDQSESFTDFDFLNSISHRIRSIILLGGEPFYDKNCLKFLDWWRINSKAELTTFTNGSYIDFDFLQSLTNQITLVFSIDAIGRPAEYIRYGTNWPVVWNNLQKARLTKGIDVRINITVSVYNFYYLDEIIDTFIDNWPSVITFGLINEEHFNISVIPYIHRSIIQTKLLSSIEKLKISSIEEGQRWNAINALQSIVNDLDNISFNQKNHDRFKNFVEKMDLVKGINIADYCPYVSNIIS